MGTTLSSNSKPGKDGSEWKGEIYFDPDADVGSGTVHRVKPTELHSKLNSLIKIGPSEGIRRIWIYTHRLEDWQIVEGLMFHAYVVLKTGEWYWSIEKNDEGITIQRSRIEEYVKDKYRRTERLSPINCHVNDTSKSGMTMRDLVDWLFQEGELEKTYHWLHVEDNCKGFAKRLFNRIAGRKTCEFLEH